MWTNEWTDGENAATCLLDGTVLSANTTGVLHNTEISGGGLSETFPGSYGSGYVTAGDLVTVSDGTVYGLVKPSATSTNPDLLVTVNPSNGVATLIGATGFTNLWGVAYSKGKLLAFSSTGQIVSINPATGAGTLVTTIAGKAFYGAASNPLTPK